MAKVIARHTIYRRVGNVIEKIMAGTEFEPQHEDEMDELIESNATYHSSEEKFAYERALEGASGLRQKPGIQEFKIGAHIVAMEKDAVSGDLPASAAFDPVSGSAARQAQETARQRREQRQSAGKKQNPSRDSVL